MGKRLRSSPCPAAAQPLLRPPSPQTLPPPSPRFSAAWRRCPRAGALRGRVAAGGAGSRGAPWARAALQPCQAAAGGGAGSGGGGALCEAAAADERRRRASMSAARD